MADVHLPEAHLPYPKPTSLLPISHLPPAVGHFCKQMELSDGLEGPPFYQILYGDMLVGLPPPENVPEILDEELLVADQQIADHVDVKATHADGQLLALVQLHVPVEVIHVDLGGVGAAVGVDLEEDAAVGGEGEGAETHGEGTDGGDGDTLHGALHQGAVQRHALAVGAHRREEQQPVPLELPDLDLLVAAAAVQVQVQYQDGGVEAARDLDLADGLAQGLAVLVHAHLHLRLEGEVAAVDLPHHQFEDGVHVEVGVVVEDGGAAVGDAEDGGTLHEGEAGAGLHQRLVLPHHEHELHLPQSFGVGAFQDLHILPLLLLPPDGCPAKQIVSLYFSQQQVDL